MGLIEKIKSIEKYVCEYFEDLDLDDPVEEGCFAEYEEVQGATDKEIHDFESHFNIVLPKDLKEIYTYKNGSRFFWFSPCYGLLSQSMTWLLYQLPRELKYPLNSCKVSSERLQLHQTI